MYELVTPAKAGVQSARIQSVRMGFVDSGLRWNDIS